VRLLAIALAPGPATLPGQLATGGETPTLRKHGGHGLARCLHYRMVMQPSLVRSACAVDLVQATMEIMVIPPIHYVREIKPVAFPETDPEWEMGESTQHQLLCEVLRSLLRIATNEQMVCSDQFLYFDGSNPKRKCAPDAFVKLGMPWAPIRSWKIWESGVPELCVEVLSPSEFENLTLEEKLARFHIIGVPEVVAFDPDGRVGERLRAWDRVDGDLVERVVQEERTPCRALAMTFVIAPAPMHHLEAALRLWDPVRNALVPTLAEAERAEKEAERAEKEAERAEKEAERAEKEAERAEKEAVRAEKEVAQVEKEQQRVENERLVAENERLKAMLAAR
jgi:Uma2 family endonuclease